MGENNSTYLIKNFMFATFWYFFVNLQKAPPSIKGLQGLFISSFPPPCTLTCIVQQRELTEHIYFVLGVHIAIPGSYVNRACWPWLPNEKRVFWDGVFFPLENCLAQLSICLNNFFFFFLLLLLLFLIPLPGRWKFYPPVSSPLSPFIFFST